VTACAGHFYGDREERRCSNDMHESGCCSGNGTLTLNIMAEGGVRGEDWQLVEESPSRHSSPLT